MEDENKQESILKTSPSYERFVKKESRNDSEQLSSIIRDMKIRNSSKTLTSYFHIGNQPKDKRNTFSYIPTSKKPMTSIEKIIKTLKQISTKLTEHNETFLSNETEW